MNPKKFDHFCPAFAWPNYVNLYLIMTGQGESDSDSDESDTSEEEKGDPDYFTGSEFGDSDDLESIEIEDRERSACAIRSLKRRRNTLFKEAFKYTDDESD